MSPSEVWRGCDKSCHHSGMTASEKKKQVARDRLTELTTRYQAIEEQLNEVRQEVNAEIVSILKAQILGPSEVARLSPYERQHVGRIAKAANIPPLREGTVVSKAKAAGSDTSG